MIRTISLDAATRESLAILGEAYLICRKRLSWVEWRIFKARRENDYDAARRLSREARERNRTLRSLYEARVMLAQGWPS